MDQIPNLRRVDDELRNWRATRLLELIIQGCKLQIVHKNVVCMDRKCKVSCYKRPPLARATSYRILVYVTREWEAVGFFNQQATLAATINSPLLRQS